ncbi:protein adenylyltransferase SelO family protein [Pelagibacterium lacus]|uniref:Protein nucleotidyltransferase YdiU n=1 Tax=Pelagibacterium lacus TaxID=2282655 RepID=A0A369W8Q3_9HYPH|nr:YdiU family protein [Pelagibacterium lacus]RDE09642.1 YdiU family protein [Pelagibacterium lacus]
MSEEKQRGEFRGATVHERLGAGFFDPVAPADFPKTILRFRNQRWAERMGLGQLSDAEWVAHFGRFAPLPDSLVRPLALRYHGHQFRAYNPDLGDGRGFLYAQAHDPVDGRLRDLATKGSGTTPWSRGGDGRLTLKGGLREVLATQMLEALGVETSKSFSLIETGEALYRGDEPSPTRSAVLVRLSHSHIRIGTFQRLDHMGDRTGLQRLLDHCIAHYYPELDSLPEDRRGPEFLGAVATSVARVGAQWIAAGFVHGVLNSDNINITGESFDYGPWRFLPAYDPGFTAAYFDQGGLYAFGRQPDALAWNLTRLAECLVPLSSVEALEPELNRFWPAFQRALALAVIARLGLEPVSPQEDADLTSAFFAFMSAGRPDYERVYFDWRGGLLSRRRAERSPQAEAYRSEPFSAFERLLAGFPPAAMVNLDHPYFARPAPRTMLVEDVETIWTPIAGADDWSVFTAALDEIAELGAAYGQGIFAGSFTAN